MIDPFTMIHLKMSVELGGLHWPAKEASKLLPRYCHPLLLENAMKAHQVSVAGSSFLLRYRNELLQVACFHQLLNVGRKAQDVRLSRTDGTNTYLLSPSNGYTPQEFPAEFENMRDLFVSRYQTNQDDLVRSRFLAVDRDSFRSIDDLDPKRIFGYIFIGFPTQAVVYDLKPDGEALAHLRSRWIMMLAEPTSDAIQFVPNRLYFRTVDAFKEVGLDPDGISGSPMFCLYQDRGDQCRVAVSGMITNASESGVIAVYHPDPLRRMLDGIVARVVARS